MNKFSKIEMTPELRFVILDWIQDLYLAQDYCPGREPS